MNRISNACNIKKEINNYKNDRIVCKNCYNKNKRKNNSKSLIQDNTTVSHQQQEIENGIDIKNNRTLSVGPSLPGKT